MRSHTREQAGTGTGAEPFAGDAVQPVLRSTLAYLRRGGYRGNCSGSCMRSGAYGEDGFQALHQLSLVCLGHSLLHTTNIICGQEQQPSSHEEQAPLRMIMLA